MNSSLFVKGGLPLYQTPANRRALVQLDWLRGLAALMVLIQHCQQIFFVRHIDISGLIAQVRSEQLSPLLIPFYYLSTFGREAVLAFFVLSGFFIGASVLRQWERGSWNWSDYLLRRGTRLYIVLIPALLITAFWDQLGQWLFLNTGIYQGTSTGTFEIPGEPIVERSTPGLFLANVLFLQHIHFSPFGSNNPLWSLSLEFWYYLLFPIGLYVFASKQQPLRRLLWSVLGLGVLALIGKDAAIYFLVWLLGASLCWLRPLQWASSIQRVRLLVGAASLLFAAVALGLHKLPTTHTYYARDFAVAAAFALLVYALLHQQAVRRSSLDEQLGQGLASFSYTLYLTHYPPLVFLSAWLVATGQWRPGYDQFTGFALSALVLGLYAFGLSRLTEVHTEKVRRRLSQWLLRQPTTS